MCFGSGLIVLDVIRRQVDATTVEERRFAGGTCGNVLAILAYLGLPSSAVGRIGHDMPGRELLADLAKWGVATDFLKVEIGRSTPVILQDSYVDQKGNHRHKFSWFCPICGTRMPGYRSILISTATQIESSLGNPKVFFFDRAAPGTLALARKCRDRGAVVVFEPSGLKDERLFMQCLEVADVFKYSQERLDMVAVAELADSAGIALQIATSGKDGLQAKFGRGGWKHLPAISAPRFADSAGSGDWCTAGLVAHLAKSGDIRQALVENEQEVVNGLQFGQALAALNCGFAGARGLMYAMRMPDAISALECLRRTQSVPLPPDNSPKIVERKKSIILHGVCPSDLH